SRTFRPLDRVPRPSVSKHFLPHEVPSSTIQGSRIETLSLASMRQLFTPAIWRCMFITISVRFKCESTQKSQEDLSILESMELIQ
ncbi:hypothetical protein KI387_004296, partial [Taxus chinensis]